MRPAPSKSQLNIASTHLPYQTTSRIVLSNPRTPHTASFKDFSEYQKLQFDLDRRTRLSKDSTSRPLSKSTFRIPKEKEVDKIVFEREKYKHLAFKVQELGKGFKVELVGEEGSTKSRMRISDSSIEVEDNKIWHSFPLTMANSQSTHVKIDLTSFNQTCKEEIKIIVSCENGRFKESSVTTKLSSGTSTLINPHMLVFEANEIRRKKFMDTWAQKSSKSRVCLKPLESPKVGSLISTNSLQRLVPSLSSSNIFFESVLKPKNNTCKVSTSTKDKDKAYFSKEVPSKTHVQPVTATPKTTKNFLKKPPVSLKSQKAPILSPKQATSMSQNSALFKPTPLHSKPKNPPNNLLTLSKLSMSTSRIQ